MEKYDLMYTLRLLDEMKKRPNKVDKEQERLLNKKDTKSVKELMKDYDIELKL